MLLKNSNGSPVLLLFNFQLSELRHKTKKCELHLLFAKKVVCFFSFVINQCTMKISQTKHQKIQKKLVTSVAVQK